jgi:carboxyl-terminal processing protease
MRRSIVIVLAVAACSQPPAGSASLAPSASVAGPLLAAKAPGAPAAKPEWEDEEPPAVPPEKFTDPQKAFASAKETLLKNYYSAGLTEEDLYRAAVQGMLTDVDPKMHKWNKLLSPRELAELKNDLKGEIVGIGVRIKHEPATGHMDVLSVVPGSPADKAGMKPTDLVLSVNGKTYKGRPEREVVDEIRGKLGEVVTLSVLREDKILSFSIARANVAFADVQHQVWNGVGYAWVRMFSDRTAPALEAALKDFAAQNVTSIALDLRENHGGSFDAALKCAELMVPAGATIVTLERRDGKTESFASKGTPVLPSVPMVLLTDHETSSGAELITAALTEGRHARTVGSRTYGKWSLQEIEELGNGYAMKYTTALFHAPSGKTYQGVGLTPDVEVDEEREQVERAGAIADMGARSAADVQLRTALALLRP